ncbi:MAG TPA: sulfocyanin-like copper-binding protein [Acidimicrobiales bacterium]|jgi:uncharacterized cupredoxin-like copper-binding protein|nr:sulfocyanin-like copper-binding protein [Acidimicrobiales bacterium]
MTLRSTATKFALVPIAAGGMLALSGGSPAGAATKTTTVKAVETEFHIALSQKSFKAGKYTFVAQNKGQATHALMITGPGVSNAMTPDIQPGKSAKLTVTLKKGKYDVYCPVPGHKAEGMNVNISVAGGSSASSASTTKTTSAPSGGSGF